MVKPSTSHTSLGIGSGILAGALWGLVFLAPELTAGFLPLQLSAGRYLAYGLVAAVLIAPSWRRLLRTLTWKEWRALLWLSFSGNIVYYVFLATAVQQGGVAMPSLVIGLLPIAVTLVGSRDRHAPPLRRLLPSLALSAAGLACISWQSLSSAGIDSLPGLGCAVGALVSWTIYAVNNSRWLGRLQGVSGHDWNLAMGVVTGLEALLLAVPAFAGTDTGHSSAQWLHFAGVVTSVAILCSILGNALWNVASRALPLTLMGQMIVFETLFASLYGFLWEERWPTGLEWAAMVLLVGGVVACARAHARRDD
ncbi:DMT family transporter [Massilia sp. DD77]|uniref:DMT family transporter n=1 Tax=Massilia sp. DD77 TaxID=3109349 RepID=UPI002FFE39EC